MERTRRDLRLRSRSTLLTLVLVLLGTSLARTAHWLSVPHRLCALHGTFEHDSGASEHAPSPSGAAARGPIYRSAGREHEECTLRPFTRSEAVVLVPVGPLGRPTLEEGRVLLVPPAPLPASTLFGLAPSRSPPA